MLLICLTLTACGYNRFEPMEVGLTPYIRPNISLEELCQMYKNDIAELPDGLVIGGVVMTSDSAENFYKRLVIQQGSSAVELKLGLYDSYVSYHIGQSVVFLVDGLRMTRENGTLTIGVPSSHGSSMAVDFIGSEPLVQRRLLRTTWSEPVYVPSLEISEITPAMAGRTVSLRGGSFEGGGVKTWSGEQRYLDRQSDAIIVYTNTFASFANDPLPVGICNLQGVVAIYRDKVQIKLNSSNDAVLY